MALRWFDNSNIFGLKSSPWSILWTPFALGNKGRLKNVDVKHNSHVLLVNAYDPKYCVIEAKMFAKIEAGLMSWDLTKLEIFCILYAQENYCHGSLTNQAITIDEWIIVYSWRPRWQIIRKSVKNCINLPWEVFLLFTGEKLNLESGEC